MSAALTPIGVFGGTFNPVHYGHLRSALELVQHLGLAEMRLMPSASPPHRDAPCCSAGHRAAMVELAVAGEPRLTCDRRELQRSGPSYTVDSLSHLRAELGPEHSLCMVLGGDAVRSLDKWHRWVELLELAHIVVIARPGWEIPASGPVGDWLREHLLPGPEALRERPAGGVLLERLRPLAISSTEIRAQLAAGQSPRYLLPEPVLDYIHSHGLYSDGPTTDSHRGDTAMKNDADGR